MSHAFMVGEPHISAELITVDNDGALSLLYERYSRRACARYSGRNRNVFDFGRYVVKLPINFGGIADNDLEGSVSNGANKDDGKSIQYPRTRLVYIGIFPVLFMEAVVPVDFSLVSYRQLPGWVSYVDCGQVGYTRRGRLVAYDYGRC